MDHDPHMMYSNNHSNSKRSTSHQPPIKNYNSQYESDPHVVKKLISKQKKDRSDEEYLSFSESSDEYDYYVYKVKKKSKPEKK